MDTGKGVEMQVLYIAYSLMRLEIANWIYSDSQKETLLADCTYVSMR